MLNIKEAVHEVQNGNREALVQLVLAQRHEYYRLAFVYLRHNEDALDALQEMIVSVYRHIGELRDPEAFYSWSKTILVNICRKMLKKRQTTVVVAELEGTYAQARPDERAALSTSDARYDIEAGLKKLNAYQQEAIRLRYFLDLDYESIAQITASPLGTVKSRISTGLVRLKELLGGDYR